MSLGTSKFIVRAIIAVEKKRFKELFWGMDASFLNLINIYKLR